MDKQTNKHACSASAWTSHAHEARACKCIFAYEHKSHEHQAKAVWLTLQRFNSDNKIEKKNNVKNFNDA